MILPSTKKQYAIGTDNSGDTVVGQPSIVLTYKAAAKAINMLIIWTALFFDVKW